MQAAPKPAVHDPFLWGRLRDSCRDLLLALDGFGDVGRYGGGSQVTIREAFTPALVAAVERGRDALLAIDNRLADAYFSARVDSGTSAVNAGTAPAEGAQPSPAGRSSLAAMSTRERSTRARAALHALAAASGPARSMAFATALEELDALASIQREPLPPSITGSALAHLVSAHDLAQAGHHVAAAGEVRRAVTEARAERAADLPANVGKVLRQIRTAAEKANATDVARALFFLPNITAPELESLSPGQCVLFVESLAGSLAVIGGAR